jgi:hypothetical protein
VITLHSGLPHINVNMTIAGPGAARQLLARQALSDVPGSAAAEVSAEELKASLVLFSSLLDEQQRRLYAGLRITRPKLLPKWNYTIAPLNVK